MSSSNFVHLHAHSEYSLLDGAARLTDDHGNPSAFLKAMAQSGMPALALTDHGNMFGAIEFYEGCKSVGLNPIVGCEAYMAPHSRLDRKGQSEKEATRHITLLAKNLAGYRNLMLLLSKAYLEGFYYKPRIDKELLSQHAEGIVALSGCLKGEVAQALLAGDRDGAENLIGTYRSILGPDNFYLELMDHGLEKQQRVNKELVDIAKRGEIPLVATNDCHYFRKEDAPAHDVLLCIGTGKRLDEPNRLRYEAPEFYYKSSAEMAKMFSYAPQALRATVEIAEKCSTEIPLHQMLLPHFETPAGESVESCLEKSCREGLQRLKLDSLPEYARRLRYELDIIFKMGYASYFLIVRDFIDYARRNQVPVGPGRGSGAGSLVAYSLAITMVDPIRYGLLFERFLNPDRRSMPDLDIDFSDEGRERVIEYVRGKYGMHNVAQIITFGTMQARLVVRDVGRVLGVPLPEVDRLAKLIPAGVGIAQALETIPELKEAAQSNSQAKKLLSLAQKLEGLKRHTGVHAAGIVITKEAVHCYSPLAKSGNQGVVTTQYSDVNLLKLGLLKMDFLGLRTLTIVDHACKMIRLKKNPEFDVMKIPLDDAKTYAMLREGNAFGVFQLESSGMRDLLRRLKPATFEDISATIALYRPGPMQSGMLDDFVERKNGNKKVTYAHRLLEPILKETCGAMIYQEQIMEIAKAMALFTPGQADGLRKAMGKKIIEEMQSTRQLFVDGCERNKISSKLANKVYDQIEKFGGYGFNKCVVGDTRVLDAESGLPRTVRDICRSGEGIKVWSLNGKGKCVAQPVISARSNGLRSVFKLKTCLGKEICATDNHPFYTFHGWRELQELKPGDRIAVPRILPFKKGRRWPRHRLRLLGWVLSEGNTCHPAGFYLYNKGRDQAADMIRAAREFKNTSVTLKSRRGIFEIYVRSRTAPVQGRFRPGHSPWNKGRTLETFGSYRWKRKVSGAKSWLESLGLSGKKAVEKFLPPDIFGLCGEDIAVFLGRLWSGDGFVFSRNNTTPFYATSSARLASDLQELLLRLGIMSRVVRKDFPYRGTLRPGYVVYLTSRESVAEFLRRVGPHLVGRDRGKRELKSYLARLDADRMSRDTVPAQVRNFVQREKALAGVTWKEVERRTGLCASELYRSGGEKKGFRRWTLRRLAEAFGSETLRLWAESDIYWDSVESVEAAGSEETFDLEVPETHNFVANGIFVHNSHTVAYGLVTYQTAYLKANYPIEYVTALLTSEIGRSAIDAEGRENKIVSYMEQAKSMGLAVLPPDVQRSEGTFSIVEDQGAEKILFGLLAVKNVGSGAVESILRARKAEGPFKSLDDFCRRVDLRQANKKVVESMVKAGALDRLLPGTAAKLSRARMLESLAAVMDRAGKVKQDLDKGQGLLFESAALADPEAAAGGVRPLSERDILEGEREVLGFYLSGHPLNRYRQLIKKFGARSIGDLDRAPQVKTVSLAGMITQVSHLTTKATGAPWARVKLEDLTGEATLLVFPRAYAAGIGKALRNQQIVLAKGRLSGQGEEAAAGRKELIVEELLTFEEALGQFSSRLAVLVPASARNDKTLYALRGIFSRYPGRCTVVLNLETASKESAQVVTEERVKITQTLLDELEALLGDGVWQIESAY